MTPSLGWPLIPQTLIQRERWPGRLRNVTSVSPLVYPGQQVLPDQPVLRLEREKVADSAHPSLSPSSTNQPDPSPPLVLPAGLGGRVVDVTRRGGIIIETNAFLLQGTLGAGRQIAGVLSLWQGRIQSTSRPLIPPGALLVVPEPLTFSLLRQAQASGVAGIIASSITLHDLEGFLRTDVIQLLSTSDIEQSQSSLPDLTLLFTEGLGSIPMPTHILNFLAMYQGSVALLSGTTSLPTNVVPELVISLPSQKTSTSPPLTVRPDLELTLGAMVRVSAGEYKGAVGLIDYFYSYDHSFPSQIRARALRLRQEDGSLLIVPVTHVQRIK